MSFLLIGIFGMFLKFPSALLSKLYGDMEVTLAKAVLRTSEMKMTIVTVVIKTRLIMMMVVMVVFMMLLMMTMRGTCRWMDRAHTWSPGVRPGRGNADAKVVNENAKIIDVVLHQKCHHFRHDHVPKLPCFSMNSDKDLFDKIIKIHLSTCLITDSKAPLQAVVWVQNQCSFVAVKLFAYPHHDYFVTMKIFADLHRDQSNWTPSPLARGTS